MKLAMLRIRSGLASCDQHGFFKHARNNAGFKAGNEQCFAFGAIWQAAISMISSKTQRKMQVSKQETSHASHSERWEHAGFKTGNEACFAFGAVW